MKQHSHAVSRRAAIGAFAAAPAALATRSNAAPSAEPGPGVCVLAPEAEEGPFYYDPKLVRSDIAEGRPGVPLELGLVLIEAAGCSPIAGTRVDIWHADAGGRYSGFQGFGPGHDSAPPPENRETFMRGSQQTDADGRVVFRTVYPGWYRGRTAHVHVKAFLDGRNVLTTQVYFPDGLSEYIYEKVPAYRGRDGERDTTNASDGVLAHTRNGRATFVNLREETDRYVAALTIAVDRRATSEQTRRSPPAGPPPGDSRGPPPEGMGGAARNPAPLVPGVKT